MKNNKYIKSGKAGFALNSVLLIALAGCVNIAQAQSVSIHINPPVLVTPPAEVVVDDYVYYPAYGCYYSTSRHQFFCLDGGNWTWRSAPIGVSADVVLAAPSVRMDFHDSPAHHVAEISKRYPHDYKPARVEEHRDDARVNHDVRDTHDQHDIRNDHDDHDRK